MSAAVRRLMRTGNRLAVFLYRRSNGRIGGTARGRTRVLLLTVPGRRTGTPHTTPVSYFEDGGGYLVTGTGGGTKQDPQWFGNLRAAARAHVEVGPRHLDVDVHVPSGAERDRLWREVVLARAPSFATYEEKSGRVIPVAVLTPV
jgi:deazaflavin-dependent oxidoreductase (nitroreductase family)